MNLESKVLRLFVAIALPDELQSALGALQLELMDMLPRRSTSWPKVANLHLTLRFLGNVHSGQVPELVRRLGEGVAGLGERELICERLGCFPNALFPRVVWTQVRDAKDRLAWLHERVDAAVGGFAEKPWEKEFVGHVTIARPKQITRAEAERLARFVSEAEARYFGAWTCREVELIQSQLSPGGSSYTTLAKVGL